ncbi:MAG: hypothetical protein WCC04_15985 [Terriglobales bacterium]
MKNPLRFRGRALGILLLLLIAAPAFSQSCALCYTQASSAGARMIQALRSGILILVLPPTFASVGMLFIVHRKRNQIRRMEDDHSQLDW